MNANRLRTLLLLALVCVATGGGCRSMRQDSWAVGEQEDPRNKWLEYKGLNDREQERWPDKSDIDQQRVQNEAAFRAANSGAKPGGSR